MNRLFVINNPVSYRVRNNLDKTNFPRLLFESIFHINEPLAKAAARVLISFHDRRI